MEDTNKNKVQRNDDFRLKEDKVFRDLFGLIETTTTAPTATPKKISEQIVIYVDDIASPTTKRLYIYSNKTNGWNYVDLT